MNYRSIIASEGNSLLNTGWPELAYTEKIQTLLDPGGAIERGLNDMGIEEILILDESESEHSDYVRAVIAQMLYVGIVDQDADFNDIFGEVDLGFSLQDALMSDMVRAIVSAHLFTNYLFEDEAEYDDILTLNMDDVIGNTHLILRIGERQYVEMHRTAQSYGRVLKLMRMEAPAVLVASGLKCLYSHLYTLTAGSF